MAKTLTRREAVRTGFRAAALPLLLTAERGRAQMAETLQTDRTVRVISPSDAEFVGLMETHYPGLLDDPTAKKLTSLFFIIKNFSSIGIIAATAKWTFTTANGPRVSWDNLLTMANGPVLMTGDRATVGKHGVRLVTPFFSWTPVGYSKQPTPRDWNYLLSHSPLTNFRAQQLASVTHVDMSLDGIIFKDFMMKGHDTVRLGERFTVTRNAEHDQAVLVQRLQDAGASSAAIEKMLIGTITQEADDPVGLRQRRYRDAKRRHAALLLQAYRNRTPERFNEIVSTLVNTPRTVITNSKS